MSDWAWANINNANKQANTYFISVHCEKLAHRGHKDGFSFSKSRDHFLSAEKKTIEKGKLSNFNFFLSNSPLASAFDVVASVAAAVVAFRVLVGHGEVPVAVAAVGR